MQIGIISDTHGKLPLGVLNIFKRNPDPINVRKISIANSDVIGWKNTIKKQKTNISRVNSVFLLV